MIFAELWPSGVRELRIMVLALIAEENMALANAFAGEVEDDSTLELDRAEIAAAVAVALGELRTAYPEGVQ